MILNRKTIVVNFKKLTGGDALRLAENLNTSDDFLLDKYDIILAVQPQDVALIARYCKFRIFVQDIFSDEENSFLSTFNNEADGVILNHPEKKLTPQQLRHSIQKARQLGLQTLICATSISEAIEMNKYDPTYIGLEYELLIGKDDSFINYCPGIVEQAKSSIDTDILIGAGIKTSSDLEHVLNTGGSGVLISSLILKSKDPVSTLKNFLN